MNNRRTLQQALTGSANIRFADMVALIEAFGFQLARVRGSHYIFTHSLVLELVNVQEVGGKAKPYQVRQFLKLVERHNLTMDGDR